MTSMREQCTSEGGLALERPPRVGKDILPIYTRNHALRTSHAIVRIAVALTDVAQHPRPHVCRVVLYEYAR